MEIEQIKSENSDWLRICGESAPEVTSVLFKRVSDCVTAGDFSWDEVAYVSAVSMRAGSKDLLVSDAQLEKIRRACQLWDVDFRLREIQSHRKLVGPIIVAFKKLLYPVLKAFLKDFIRQQRSFNAAILALVVDQYSTAGSASPAAEDCEERS